MDDFEKRVLRRKRPVFAESVEINEDLLDGMKRSGLLTDSEARELLVERHSNTRAARLIDRLCNTTCVNGFEALTSLLTVEYPWLSRDLEYDVRSERGNLQVDDDVEREAAMLVHRKFGTSKRLCELDKKEITQLIAVKIQLSKEEWKAEMHKLHHEMRQVLNMSKQKESDIKTLDKQVENFIRQNRKALTTRAHDLTSTTDVLRDSVADNDVIAKMKTRLDYVLARTRRVISDRDLLWQDRAKCFKLLGYSDADSMLLHQVVELKLMEMPKAVQSYQEEITKKEQTMRRVRRLVQEYEAETQEKDERILRMEQELAEKDKDLATMEQRIRHLEDEKLNQELLWRAQSAYANPRGHVTSTKLRAQTAHPGMRSRARSGKRNGLP